MPSTIVIADRYLIKEIHIQKSYSEHELFTLVLTIITESRNTASILSILAAEASMREFGLQHLKRVRPVHSNESASAKSSYVEIIVCPTSHRDMLPPASSQLLETQSSHQRDTESSGRDSLLTKSVQTVKVPSFAPQSQPEFMEWCPYWPMTYHPGESERQRSKGLDATDTVQILGNWETLMQLGDSALLVNPVSNQVICTASDAVKRISQGLHSTLDSISSHPLLTPELLCINFCADIAKGEIPDRLDKLPIGYYLCTGLDLYTAIEPNLFSSMALVHSRIRRVFFGQVSEDGALLTGSQHIHCLKQLNHHYRVFQIINPTQQESIKI